MKIFKNRFWDLGFVTGKIDKKHLLEFEKYDFPDTTYYDTYNLVNEPLVDFVTGKEKLLKIDNSLEKLQEKIESAIVSELFEKFTRHNRDIWSGMDEPTTKFHNDGIEGHDLSLLIYLDKPNTKNFLKIKNPLKTETFYPGNGEFIVINQNKMFLHRAENGEGMRRVISFEYKLC